MERQCNKCNIVKPIELFKKRKGNIYHNFCKECNNVIARRRYYDNIESERERNREYRNAFKDSINREKREKNAIKRREKLLEDEPRMQIYNYSNGEDEFIPLSQFDTTILTHDNLDMELLRRIARLHDIIPGNSTKSQLINKMLNLCSCEHYEGIAVDGTITREHPILSRSAYPTPKPRV